MNHDELLFRLRTIFLDELEENLCAIENLLVSIESGMIEGGSDERVNELYRAVHSIKGASATIAAEEIKKLAHKAENMLSAIKEGAKNLDDSSIQFLFNCVDQFRVLSSDIEPSNDDLIPEIEEFSKKNTSTNKKLDSAISSEYTTETKIKSDAQLNRGVRDYSEDYVSVSSKRLERMQNLVLNLDIYVRGLAELSFNLEKKLNQIQPDQLALMDKRSWRVLQSENSKVAKKIGQIHRMLAPLDEEVLKANMQRFSDAFSWVPRMVRDQAKEAGKKVQLVVVGGEVEISSALVSLLSNPLRHLIRNAIDHGIESEKTREKSGKSTTGTIFLEVSSQSRRLELVFRDDGRGLDLSSIREAASLRGVDATLAEDKLIELIFLSGFTTSKSVSDVSGRGVGLDAVKKGLMRYGGTISVVSERDGIGTAFCMSLPIHVYRIRALLFTSGGSSFAIDCSEVESLIRISKEREYSAMGGVFTDAQVRPFPYISLSHLLQIKSTESNDSLSSKHTLIVLNVGGMRAGIIVDTVDEVLDVLIKELPPRIGRTPILQGSVVTGLGDISYVLNVEEVVRQVLNQRVGGDRDLAKEKYSSAKKRLLVVDDTFTTSALIETILENAGFDIVSARDGEQAWTILTQQKIDLLVSDFEMPQLNGVDLTRRIRESSKLKNLPVILLTGRDSHEDRLRGLDAGADVYLIKSAFDQSELLQSINELL